MGVKVKYMVVLKSEWFINLNENGVAHVKEVDAKKSEVILKYENGTTESFIVFTDSLVVADGDTVTDIDKVGTINVVTKGILIEGLIITLQLSVYAVF